MPGLRFIYITHVVSKITWGIGWTFIRALRSLKNCSLMGSFCQKHIRFQLESFRGIMCYDTERWCKIKGKLTCGLKNDTRNLVNFHVSSRKSWNFHFEWIPLSEAYKDLDEKVQKGYFSYHERVSKVWRKTDSWFQKWHEELVELSLQHSKIWKSVHWWTLFV